MSLYRIGARVFFVVYRKYFENAYCYRHLKNNFSSYFNKHNTKGNKGKENVLEWLDKIAYARVETDYNYHMFDL